MGGGGGGSVSFGKPMSGGGSGGGVSGGGGGGGGGSGSGDGYICSKIRFKTILQSPKPPASLLNVGDILKLELQATTTVVAIDSSNRLVGVILPSNILDLVNCLLSGTIYEGKVEGAKGGATEVLVYAK